MKIKITLSNAAKIETALKAVNAEARYYTFTTFEEINYLAVRAEALLSNNYLKKSQFCGAEFIAESGNLILNKSAYPRVTTTVRLVRGLTAWFLTHIEDSFLGNEAGKSFLHLTRFQHEASIKNFKESQ